MELKLKTILLDEGPYHVGWYRIYKIKQGITISFHTFRYHNISPKERMWAGIIQINGDHSFEHMKSLEALDLFSDKALIQRIPYTQKEEMPMIITPEKDMVYVCQRLMEHYDKLTSKS